MRLGRTFFENETHLVAQSLIGKLIVRYVSFYGNYYRLSGLITETEAYGYLNDPASHAFKGETMRNRPMFGQVGKAYVYFIYGNHYCLNVVAKAQNDHAGAVLIRSIEPIDGIGLMKIFRNTEEISKLTTGPGRLAQALRITRKHNNLDLADMNNKILYIEDNRCPKIGKDFILESSERIGISLANEIQWRYIMLVRNSSYDGFVPSSFISKQS
ncbi:DNA-3-methyladenine glycosylase [Candidatus Nitrosocosmicus franklandus]|uniref:Putative 3-methyladenine DNA glycosylase n=1 Tax=Candidatus Nitrosocosmicus franklandianus TaxID=1798806 RepID=A0A484IC20_9ARCH|nr:DNA-3-methyladenine glycosylase [Candidatus Nitrosocosmicus franklandus]VFJ15323.1 putative 3-methyladenine DNA glycosylase [Candidatus Nitrosocosmicus franklandus]